MGWGKERNALFLSLPLFYLLPYVDMLENVLCCNSSLRDEEGVIWVKKRQKGISQQLDEAVVILMPGSAAREMQAMDWVKNSIEKQIND